MVLIRKNGLWRVYATQWVGLGLWGICVSHENCISYARQTRVTEEMTLQAAFVHKVTSQN